MAKPKAIATTTLPVTDPKGNRVLSAIVPKKLAIGLAEMTWFLTKHKGSPAAFATMNWKSADGGKIDFFLHDVLQGSRAGFEVIPVDGNFLNCAPSNLQSVPHDQAKAFWDKLRTASPASPRPASPQHRSSVPPRQARAGKRSSSRPHGTGKHDGIYWEAGCRKWRCEVARPDGRHILFGRFPDQKDAVLAKALAAYLATGSASKTGFRAQTLKAALTASAPLPENTLRRRLGIAC